MKEKVKRIITRLNPNYVPAMLATFLKDESVSGKLILIATALALVAVNSPLNEFYETIWHTDLRIGIGRWELTHSLLHWVNEGLMAIFFLVVGLEIKREIITGELRDLRLVKLPIAAALGGMLVPALIYAALNTNPEVRNGWGIPIATDIAFAVGILMMLGKKVPLSLKLFLLTLAIADDIGGIVVIALFYAGTINFGFLAAAIGLVAIMWLCNQQLRRHVLIFILLGTGLWLATHLSGIHASIAGAIVGLLAPMTKPNPESNSVAETLEGEFLPVSTYLVLPLFAFANAGVVLSTSAFDNPLSGNLLLGIVLGLVVGKMIGIVGATWLMVKLKASDLPGGTSWRHIVGVGFLAGIGFTVSLFVTELAFSGKNELLEVAKISVFIASSLSALLGTALLFRAKSTAMKDRSQGV